MNLWTRIKWWWDDRLPAYIWEEVDKGRFYAESPWHGKLGFVDKIDIPYPQHVTQGNTVGYLEGLGYKVTLRKRTGLYK